MSNIFDDANLENITYEPGSHLSIIDAPEKWITVLTYGLGYRGINWAIGTVKVWYTFRGNFVVWTWSLLLIGSYWKLIVVGFLLLSSFDLGEYYVDIIMKALNMKNLGKIKQSQGLSKQADAYHDFL